MSEDIIIHKCKSYLNSIMETLSNVSDLGEINSTDKEIILKYLEELRKQFKN